MSELRFLTSGESHGKALITVIEGMPAGFALSAGDVDKELLRRQRGYGRGGRMKIEADRVEILSGVRWGRTLGSPVCLRIENKDWANWQEGMSAERRHLGAIGPVTKPRPGHADLAGVLKYAHEDIRNVLERSSARETAMRVAVGAVAKKFLSEFGAVIGSYVVQIGSARTRRDVLRSIREDRPLPQDMEVRLISFFKRAEESEVRCPEPAAAGRMVKEIDKATKAGNSLGGVFEVFATGVPVGLGSHVHWDRKLDGRLAQAFMSIQAIKGVEIGLGFGMAGMRGSEAMDEIYYGPNSAKGSGGRFFRRTDNAGGIEGGISNGMPIVVRAAMKPIPTLRRPLKSVDIRTKESFEAAYERSDICAVPAAGVVAEAMTAFVLADAFLEKFGGDSRKEIMRNFKSYAKYLGSF